MVLVSLATPGFANSPVPAGTVEPCSPDQVCGLKSAEDLVRLPGSRWAIVSRLTKDPEAPSGFSAVDLERRTARFLVPDVSGRAAAAYSDCPGAPVASELVTHGLDLRWQPGGTSELFAVNHGRRESLEVFSLTVSKEGPKLTWKGCVILPSDVSANAVAALPDGVAVTSFGTAGAQGNADLLAGKPAGFVARWTPHRGVAPVILKLGDFHPDNVHGLPDGNLLIAGQVGKAADIMGCVGAPTCSVGSMIVTVDLNAHRVRSSWSVAPTSSFGAASTALLYGRDYWVSSFRGDRIVRLGPGPAN